jgi:type II secretory pathway pseudopilin PulG
MEFKPTKIRVRQAGFTAIEMVFAAGISVVILTAAAVFFLFSLRSFASIANYADLNGKDRYATDVLTRDIRNALQVVSSTANQIVLKAPPVAGSNTVTYTYDSTAKTLSRVDNSSSKTLLTGVSSCSFSLYQRPTTNSYDKFPAGDINNVKLIGYKWSCTRKLVGTQSESESVQMAKVSIRNE